MSSRRRPPIQWLLVLSLAGAGLIASIVILVVVLAAVTPSLRRDAVDRQARELRGQVAAIAQSNRLNAPITPAKARALAETARRETGGEVRVSYGPPGAARQQVVVPAGATHALNLFTSAGDAAFTLIDSPQQIAIASRSPVYAGGDAGSLTQIGTLTVAEAVNGSSPELEQATRGAIIAAAVILLLAIITGWLLSVVIGRPAIRLSRTARDLAEGNLSARAPGGGPRELDSLAGDLNTMAARLDALLEAERQLAQARRDLVANASHELKTPVAGIKGLQELIATGAHGPGEEHELIALIGVEVRRLERLVHEQLELARLDAGELPIHIVECDVGGLPAQAVAPQRPLANSAGVVLSASTPSARVMALADASRIEQVLLILIDNAIAHTPAGGKVTVSAADDGQWVRLSVSDTGSGIPAEDHAAVFERFARRDDARTRVGTGLGLAIARGIVEAHDGRIDLVSAPGEGAMFTVLLPRAPAR
ncbi:MAG: sensor histidine kinase [Miltoncostaeaceae bacterium]